jgi:hypothetical protein
MLAAQLAIPATGIDLARVDVDMMGLSEAGQPVGQMTTGAAWLVGVPAALIGGALTTAVFGFAFSLAKTQKAWTPALLIGGAAAVGSLLRVAVASR